MYDVNLMIGIGFIALILVYSAFKAWEIDHKMLGIILFFGGIMCALLIINVLYVNPQNCYVAVNTSTVDGSGLTSYTYQQLCYAQDTGVLDNFNKFYNNMIYIFYAYLFVAFLIYFFGETLQKAVLKRIKR